MQIWRMEKQAKESTVLSPLTHLPTCAVFIVCNMMIMITMMRLLSHDHIQLHTTAVSLPTTSCSEGVLEES